MPRYALLLLPAANRAYLDHAIQLACSELAVVAGAALQGRIGSIEAMTLAGVPYVSFTADRLEPQELRWLSNLSCTYALFERVEVCLRPIPLQRAERLDADLVTIPRYVGKTNEHFTKLLLVVALAATRGAHDLWQRRPRVLDPLCGRGTTLSQVLACGFDAAGIEIDARDFDAYRTFLSAWLRRKRLKHDARLAPVKRGGKDLGRRLDLRIGASAEEYRAGHALELTLVQGDTCEGCELFRAGSFTAVVADAPYGVQHASLGDRRTRDPLQLLTRAVPAWTRVLEPGGALALAWNTHVAARETLAAILAGSGLEVQDDDAWRGFRHRVDQAIARDLIVARKPWQAEPRR
jgi:SAM-dependent methyltransferase